MGKIDKMVQENERNHFEMDVTTLQDIEDRKREVELTDGDTQTEIYSEG